MKILCCCGVAAALGAYFLSLEAAAGLTLLVLLVITMATIPPLDHGEMDYLGLSIAGLVMLVCIYAWLTNPGPNIRWTKDMCGDGNCPEAGAD